ncbi:response regulator [Sphingomonas radiodurans]|uniref:response regulator n=1 Tax=Sphingomonas radiodurans TaxID=2890321 RepID=UPI001E61B783|nr:response regulator [Sphingomonas radiodurans]WBH15825.1 response regulator [Sphingomonas radiodurans]
MISNLERGISLEEQVVILVVDDDADIRDLLVEYLSSRGYRAFACKDVLAMEAVLARETVDLVLLDVMMPGEDGLSACRRLSDQAGPPVVMLSALGREHDRIRGLEVGAGHYLSKPCSAREVLATVQAALRSRGAVTLSGHGYVFEGWRIDVEAHELVDPDGVLVQLTDGEFALLRAMIERPRRVLTRDQLLHFARGPDSDAFDRAVDVQISRLRRKLRAPGDALIRTVKNEGYVFAPHVRRA